MPEFAVWLVAGVVGVASLALVIYPEILVRRYENVMRKPPEKP